MEQMLKKESLDERIVRELELDEETFVCPITTRVAFDPVKLSHHHHNHVFHRDFLETKLEKEENPKNPYNDQQFYTAEDIIPNDSLRKELREKYENRYGSGTSVAVVPTYPINLNFSQIDEAFQEIRSCFASGVKELKDLNADGWFVAYTRLNFLRLNLQFEPINRSVLARYRSGSEMSSFIQILGEIIALSYSVHVDTDDSQRLHREILRTIKLLLWNENQNSVNKLAFKLVHGDPPPSPTRLAFPQPQTNRHSQVCGFLLRLYRLRDLGFRLLILRLLHAIYHTDYIPRDEEIACILEPFRVAEAGYLSSDHLNIALDILEAFYNNNMEDKQRLFRLCPRAVPALVNITRTLLSYEKKKDMPDLIRALLLFEGFIDLGDGALTCSLVYPDILSILHENMVFDLESDMFDLHQREICCRIVRKLYQKFGTLNTMKKEHYKFYKRLLGYHKRKYRPHQLPMNVIKSLEEIIDIFHNFFSHIISDPHPPKQL